MTQVAVAADSIGMTIPLHNPNENDLVCQGQFTRVRAYGFPGTGSNGYVVELESEHRGRQQITVARKHLLAVVSLRHHMVEQPTCMYPGMVWHARQIAKLIDLGKSDTKISSLRTLRMGPNGTQPLDHFDGV